MSVADLDLRVGWRFRIVFGGPKGNEHECAGIYREVVPNRKLVSTWCWPDTTPDRVSQVSASIGVASYPANGADAEELLGAADAAMYLAKQSGKGQLRFA